MSPRRVWFRVHPSAGMVLGYSMAAVVCTGGSIGALVPSGLALLPGALGIAWYTRGPMPFAARKRACGRGLAVVVAAWSIPALAYGVMMSLGAAQRGVGWTLAAIAFFAGSVVGIGLLANGLALAIALGLAWWARDAADGSEPRIG